MTKYLDNVLPSPAYRQVALADKVGLSSVDLPVALCTTSCERSCIQ